MSQEIKLFLTPEDIAYYQKLGFNLYSDLLNPKVDSVLKAMLTTDTEDSRQARIHFLSNVLKRNVTTVVINNIEMPAIEALENQSSFDIYVKYDNGDEADIEMQIQILTPEDMDRDDYIVYYHRRKAEIDRVSQILYARDQGFQEGYQNGLEKGYQKCIEEGRQKGIFEGQEGEAFK